MKNSIDKSRDYGILENYFRRTFTADGHFASYDEIREVTGLDIRSGVNQKNYNTFAKLRDTLRVDSDPLMLEVERGKGVIRVRVGWGAHAKGDDALAAIRRKSRKMIDLAVTGRLNSVNDEESHKNQTMARIYSVVLTQTSRDAKSEMFATVSNDFHPLRRFVGLRSILRKSRENISA